MKKGTPQDHMIKAAPEDRLHIILIHPGPHRHAMGAEVDQTVETGRSLGHTPDHQAHQFHLDTQAAPHAAPDHLRCLRRPRQEAGHFPGEGAHIPEVHLGGDEDRITILHTHAPDLLQAENKASCHYSIKSFISFYFQLEYCWFCCCTGPQPTVNDFTGHFVKYSPKSNNHSNSRRLHGCQFLFYEDKNRHKICCG